MTIKSMDYATSSIASPLLWRGRERSFCLLLQYSIFPNPNNGIMNILQAAPDNNPVNAKLMDAKGVVLYKGDLQFSGGKTPFNLKGIVPGLYLLQLRDSKGNNYELKFIIDN